MVNFCKFTHSNKINKKVNKNRFGLIQHNNMDTSISGD